MKNVSLSKWLVSVAVVATLIFNMLAVLLPLNGITTSEVSDKFPVYFVPANYVFAIWSVIYIGLIAFAIYQWMLKDKDYGLVLKIMPWFVLASFANSVWLLTWHYGVFYWGLVLMLVLLICLIVVYQTIVSTKEKDAPKQTSRFIKLPISIYLGWISVATIANVTDVLHLLRWDGFGMTGVTWAAFMVLIASVLGILMLVRHKDYIFMAVLVWALTGIAAKFPEESMLVSSVVFGCFAMLAVAVGFAMHDLKMLGKKQKK